MQHSSQLRFFVAMGLVVLGCVTCGTRSALEESSLGGRGGAGGKPTTSASSVTATVGVTSTSVATTGVASSGPTTTSAGVGGSTTTGGVGGSETTGVGGATTTGGVGGSDTTGVGGTGGSVATSSSSSGMPECAPTCATDTDCQDSCPMPKHGIFCCDAQTQACYHYHHHHCPAVMGSSSSSSGY